MHSYFLELSLTIAPAQLHFGMGHALSVRRYGGGLDRWSRQGRWKHRTGKSGRRLERV